ncbi:MAG: radical SAM protein, partial [Anaerolineales bacterium]|nr:radical SAM protein [Anaerolineales bacterium]
MPSQVEAIKLPDFPLWDRAARKHIPLSIDLEFTERCNCNCRHCYINLPANDRTAKSQELTFAEIRNIFDQAVELGSLWCLMTGGEPLVREDFAEIYLYAKKKGLLASIFTNATLIDDKFIELIKRYPPRDLEVSVYGVTRETYERVTRVPGSFEAFSRGV